MRGFQVGRNSFWSLRGPFPGPWVVLATSILPDWPWLVPVIWAFLPMNQMALDQMLLPFFELPCCWVRWRCCGCEVSSLLGEIALLLPWSFSSFQSWGTSPGTSARCSPLEARSLAPKENLESLAQLATQQTLCQNIWWAWGAAANHRHPEPQNQTPLQAQPQIVIPLLKKCVYSQSLLSTKNAHQVKKQTKLFLRNYPRGCKIIMSGALPISKD